MKLQDRNLNIRMRGEDVELLQKELRQPGRVHFMHHKQLALKMYPA